MRIYEIARRLNVPSNTVIGYLDYLGCHVRCASSKVPNFMASTFIDWFEGAV